VNIPTWNYSFGTTKGKKHKQISQQANPIYLKSYNNNNNNNNNNKNEKED
jgi:hypothetical protein